MDIECFQKICRVCLKTEYEMQNIFNSSIGLILTQCASVQVNIRLYFLLSIVY